MAEQHASLSLQVAGVFASAVRNANERLLTIDTTVRSLLLTPGAYRLYGSATQIYYALRLCDSGGTLASGESAPTTTTLAAPAAGSPAAGSLWDNAQTRTDPAVPTDISKFVVIPVRPGTNVLLYLRVAAASTTTRLVGPFEAPQ